MGGGGGAQNAPPGLSCPPFSFCKGGDPERRLRPCWGVLLGAGGSSIPLPPLQLPYPLSGSSRGRGPASPSQSHGGVQSDPAATPLAGVGVSCEAGPPTMPATACAGGGADLPAGSGEGESGETPRAAAAGAVLLPTVRSQRWEPRLGGHSAGLSCSGSLLCGVNYLRSVGFRPGFYFFVLWDYFLANEASF